MSESQEGKRDKALRANALAYSPGEDGLWDWGAIANAVNYGNGIPVGARFKAPASMADLYIMNLGNGTSPEGGSVGLDEFMGKYGLTLPEYQQRFGGLPFVFNADGTATYDPSAQKNSFSYTPEKTFMDYVGPAAFALIGGAALGGLGAAGEGAAGGASAGGAMDMGVGLGGELGSWGGVTPLADGAGSFISEIPMGATSNAFESGINFADSFNPLPSWDAINPTNINLSSGGFNSIDDIINSIASGGSQTFGSVGAGGAVGGGLGMAPLAGMEPSLLDSLVSLASKGTSPISKIISGNSSLDDWLKVGGTALSSALGYKSASDKNDAFTDLANKYLNLGAPARVRLEQSYADPMSFLNGPDVQSITQQGSDAAARSLSTKYGNPALSPAAWGELTKFNTNNQWNQLSNYRNQLSAQGGLGVAPAASFDANAASTSGTGLDVLGAALGDITNPKKSILQQMQELAKMNGLGTMVSA